MLTRTLYRLIPGFIGKPIYRRLKALLATLRTQQSAALPSLELRAEHLAHLHVVPDRRAFVERLPKGACVAELGVADGDFSELILTIAQPRRLHLIDAWDHARFQRGQARVRERFASAIAAGQVAIDVGISYEALERFPDAHFDWIYIDTDHTYRTTQRELRVCAQKLKPSGLIAGHDYVTGNWNSGMRYGVVEAVHEFCVEAGWELILLTHETDRHLSFALRRITAA